MIDTVNFRIPIDEIGYQKLVEHSKVHVGYDYATKEVSYKIVKVPIRIGSFSNDRTIRVPRMYTKGYANFAELELSIPKYLFGHNVRMITVPQFNEACVLIQKDLKNVLDFDTNVKDWVIQKLDLCYNWKLSSKDELNTYLKIFQNLDYSRKKPYRYDTSVMFTGSAYTVKFYSKYDEYIKNSYKELDKINSTLAFDVMQLAENILRFEVALKKPQFKTVFGSKLIHISDNTEKFIYNYLNLYLTKLVKVTNTKVAKNDAIFNTLKERFDEVVGRGLYEKYRLWSSTDPTDKETFKSYSYSIKYKFFKAIKKTNISLSGESDFNFELTIPSKNAVF